MRSERSAGTRTTILLVAALAVSGAAASERAETRLTHEQPLAAGGWIGVENLVGSMTVRSGGKPGLVTVEARVVAEADTRELASALAGSVRLDLRDGDAGRLVHVSYPVEQHSAFRMPRSESEGLIAKWMPPLLHRKTVAVSYDDRLVQVGKSKGASALAVHLEIRLPLEIRASLTQTVGTIHCLGLRGEIDLEVVEGTLLAEQIYGGLQARTAGGELTVTKFRGERFDLQTSSGDIALADVEAGETRLRSSSGAIEGRTISAGAMTVDTATGDVTLEDLESIRLILNTESGHVDLGSKLQRTREASIHSASGDVTLRVGMLAPFDLEARTESGSFKNRGVSLEVLDEDDRGASVRRGRGGAELQIATVSGGGDRPAAVDPATAATWDGIGRRATLLRDVLRKIPQQPPSGRPARR